MKKNKAVFLTAIITFVSTLVVMGLIFVIGLPEGEIDPVEVLTSKVRIINNLIERKSIKDFDSDKAVENAIYAYVATLDDQYAMYFDKEYYSEFVNDLKGSHVGIGMTVKSPKTEYVDAEGLHILRVVGGSPAESAGIKADDIITAVNGTETAGLLYNDVYNSLLGEEGTVINLTISRNGEKLDFSVTRSTYVSRDVDYRMIDGNVGFIRIHEFSSETTYKQFEEALQTLISQGAKGFIYDVRNNPGGDYDSVVNVLNLLVDKDILAVLTYKNDEKIEYSSGNRLTDLPSVVLLNGSSASAAELFSSALRDLNASPLVGTKSYGKGVGQEYVGMTDGSGIKITTFTYTTKSRVNYDGVGLMPDYAADTDVNIYSADETTDAQLQKAIEVLKTLQ